jgi:hypothetical protein
VTGSRSSDLSSAREKTKGGGGEKSCPFCLFPLAHPMALEMWLHLFLSSENDNCVRLTRLLPCTPEKKKRKKQNNEMTSDPLLP